MPETGAALAAEYGHADLVAGNNVYAHIPDLVGFTAGLADCWSSRTGWSRWSSRTCCG